MHGKKPASNSREGTNHFPNGRGHPSNANHHVQAPDSPLGWTVHPKGNPTSNPARGARSKILGIPNKGNRYETNKFLEFPTFGRTKSKSNRQPGSGEGCPQVQRAWRPGREGIWISFLWEWTHGLGILWGLTFLGESCLWSLAVAPQAV